MIDPAQAAAIQFPAVDAVWDPDRVALYHLSIGAGLDPSDPDELAYVYERDLRVLPTFGCSLASEALLRCLAHRALGIEKDSFLHAAHGFWVRDRLPREARVRQLTRVAAVWRRGTAALLDIDIDTFDRDDELLVRNRFRIHVRDALRDSAEARGASGAALQQPPSPTPAVPGSPAAPGSPGLPPQLGAGGRRWDLQVRIPAQAALMYRLIGDRHPLHVDPEAARRAGFEGPILPGLCTLGAVTKAIADELGSRTIRIASGSVRFAGVVYPGEELAVSVWSDEGSPDRLCLHATVPDRGATVLDHGVLWLRP